ncbi:unnamed protein product [Mytilus edulis]|uniref:Uncharacterized protein n=1 Tax=Mytilus edulis TaxID=6550 RepID=A0A8S3V6R9_MYTED|nr:unnamed protein product [Mytilus edulis]
MLCGRSQPEEKETDDYSSIFDGELLLQETMSEHDSTMNTLEEPTLFLTKDKEKKTLLQTCGTQEEANEEAVNPFKNCDLSCEHKGNQYIHLNRNLKLIPQPYAAAAAAAAEFHPLVYGNHCVMPKPDSFDYSGSSSSSPSHQKESKTLKHQNSRDNKLAAHASIRNSQTCPSQGGRSSCDIDAMNNQVGNQNVSVGRLRSTNLNNSDNSRDQNTRRANSNSNKECEPVQRRLPSPLLLPQTQPVPSNRQSIETDGQDTCPGSEDISQEFHSLPVVPAVVCLSNYRTKSNEDRDCFKELTKNMLDQFTLTRRLKHLENNISKLTTEISKQIKGHHSIGNPDKGHFLFTLGKYTGQGLYISDIVQYFVQRDSLREDVIQFIKQHHTDCAMCNRLYLTVTQSFLSLQRI